MHRRSGCRFIATLTGRHIAFLQAPYVVNDLERAVARIEGMKRERQCTLDLIEQAHQISFHIQDVPLLLRDQHYRHQIEQEYVAERRCGSTGQHWKKRYPKCWGWIVDLHMRGN